MTNAAQPERNRTLVVIALVVVVIAALMNVLLLSRGKVVEWYSWALLGGLACAIGSMAMRRSARQGLLMIAGFILALCGIYGIVRH